jgi:hypothetical protein
MATHGRSTATGAFAAKPAVGTLPTPRADGRLRIQPFRQRPQKTQKNTMSAPALDPDCHGQPVTAPLACPEVVIVARRPGTKTTFGHARARTQEPMELTPKIRGWADVVGPAQLALRPTS